MYICIYIYIYMHVGHKQICMQTMGACLPNWDPNDVRPLGCECKFGCSSVACDRLNNELDWRPFCLIY